MLKIVGTSIGKSVIFSIGFYKIVLTVICGYQVEIGIFCNTSTKTNLVALAVVLSDLLVGKRGADLITARVV